MKMGICEWSIPMDGPYGLKIASEFGLKGVQLDIGSEEKGFPLSLPYVQEAYQELAEKYDITFTSIAVRVLDKYGMTREDGTPEKDIVMEAIEKSIAVAEVMNIPIVMLGSFEDGEIKTEEDLERVASCLRNSCDIAKEKGIIIATENLLSVEETKKLFAMVDKDNFKLYFDTQNYYLRRGYHVAEMVKELFDYICEVHVKDGNGYMSGSLLGKGDSSFFETMEVLKEKEYDGWVLIENYYDQKPLSQESDNPLHLLDKDVSILRKSMEVTNSIKS